MRSIYLIFIGLFPTLLYASSVKVSEEFGYNATDATTFLQQAFNAGHSFDTIIIDNVGEWITGPLDIKRSNLTIVLEPGTIITAKLGAFNDVQAKLISIRDKQHITISGYDAILRMQKPAYIALNNSEFRHAIELIGVTDVQILGLEIRDSGGDGISIGPGFLLSEKTYSDSVTIADCFIDNNYRQGISITSGENITIKNCIISNTSGTLSQSGIDFGPFENFHRLVNCKVDNCRIVNNGGMGIQNGFGELDSTSMNVDITIENTYIADNGWNNPQNKGGAITLRTDSTGVGGSITVTNSMIENQPYSAVYHQSTPDKVTLSITNTIIRNVSNKVDSTDNIPIISEIDYNRVNEPWGGINFNNVMLVDDENRPFFRAIGFFGPDRFLKDITGSIIIVNPNGVTADYGPLGGQINVTLDTINLDTVPSNVVTVEASDPEASEEGNQGLYSFFRSGAGQVPVAIQYEMNGSASNRLDYPYYNGLIIIPKFQFFGTRVLIPRSDLITEGVEEAVLSIVEDTSYVLSLLAEASILIDASVLPLDWGDISISTKNCTPYLTWATNNEVQVSHFTVEKSTDGKTWRTASTRIDPGKNNYSFHDKNHHDGSYFYRIYYEDLDGSRSYSTVLSYFDDCLSAIEVFPTLIRDYVSINWGNSRSKEQRIEIISLTGEKVVAAKIHNPSNISRIQMQGLVPGTYFLVVRSNGSQAVKVQKLIKM